MCPVEQKPLVSLCMIAKDNERTIGAALGSAKPWVDEMIVVDTGSVDKTVEIAKQLGARVEHFPWCDDFAAARNESLRYARGNWLFWMDTDDTIPFGSGQQIKRMLSAAVPDEVLGFIMQVHCPHSNLGNPTPNSLKQVSKEGGDSGTSGVEHEPRAINRQVGVDVEVGQFTPPQEGKGLRCATVVDHVKIFRNRPDLRFEGRIHEQILPSIRRAGGRVEWTECFVVHSGADYSQEGKRRKLERDLRLLRRDIEERPGHPFVLFNLGMTLLHQGAFHEASCRLEESVQQSTTDESHLRKAYSLWVDSLEGSARHTEALQRCWEGLGRYPDDPELSFKLGRILMHCRRWAEAVEAFQRGMKSDRERFFSSIDPEVGGFKSLANLAVCYSELGLGEKAVSAWQSSLLYHPDFEDAWAGIVQECRQSRDFHLLSKTIMGFRKKPAARRYVLVCEAIENGAHGRVDEAIAKFDQALSIDEHDEFVLNEYARFLNENSRWVESLDVLRRLRDSDPSSPSPHFNLGISLGQLGRYSEAVQALQVARQLRPNHKRTHELLSECRKKIVTPRKSEADSWVDPTRVLLCVCFVRREDPQRHYRWTESGDLAFAVDHWIDGVASNGLRGVILYDGLSSEFVRSRTSEFVQFQYRNQGSQHEVDPVFWTTGAGR